MAPTTHARLSASGAERWLNCPGSVKLSESMTKARQVPSVYADRGTALHTVSEQFFNQSRFVLQAGEVIPIKDYMGERSYTIEEDDIDPLMAYVDIVEGYLGQAVWQGIEIALTLSDIHPDLGGTADVGCLLYDGTLVIIDLKTGRGIMVDPVENPQMLQYGLGAFNTMPEEFRKRVTKIQLIVIQPWATVGPTVKVWDTDPAYLIEHVNTLILGTMEVEKGTTLRPGDWCRYCPARVSCPALYKTMHEVIVPAVMESENLAEVKLTPERIGKILCAWPYIDGMVDGLRQYAQRLAEAGVEIPGCKLSPKRARYVWEDDVYVANFLRGLGISDDRIWEKKLITPAKATKLVGKDQRAIIEDLKVNTATGNNLVVEAKINQLRGPDLTPNLPTLAELGL